LATRILTPELITGAEARELNGQPRTGKGRVNFGREWRQQPPPSKRPKQLASEEGPLSETAGTTMLKINNYLIKYALYQYSSAI
jgi:hypothetical protein